MMESDEESGSKHMAHYLEKYSERIGDHVRMIFILDSGVEDYETLWINTSLRGTMAFLMDIKVSK